MPKSCITLATRVSVIILLGIIQTTIDIFVKILIVVMLIVSYNIPKNFITLATGVNVENFFVLIPLRFLIEVISKVL
jgi:hypothetical protein